MKNIAVCVVSLLLYASVVPLKAEMSEITEARIAGKKDAQGFKWGWFTAGYMTANASVIAVVLAPMTLQNSLDTINPACWSTIYGVYILTPTALALIESPTPPTDRLLGKSPDWINAYTKAYKQTMRRDRAKSSAAGCFSGGTVLALTLYALSPLFFGFGYDD